MKAAAKKMNYNVFALLAAAFLYYSGFFNRFMVASLAPAAAKKMLESNTAVLVDVREENEIKSGMIQGALWLPLSGLKAGSLPDSLAKSLADKSKPLLIYCRSGARSARAALLLGEMGYQTKNIGGYDTLVKSGFNTTAPQQTAQPIAR
jgi:rhodanese-related sulfurtransferase